MSEDMHRLLSLHDKGIEEAKNAPARLLRSIFLELNMNPLAWDNAMREYLHHPRSGVPDNPTKRSSERSNLNRALSKNRVTWRQFRKALRVMNPREVHYTFHLTWDDGIVHVNEPPTTIEYEPLSRSDELATIWKQLSTDLGISPMSWRKLVDRWLMHPAQGVRDNPPDMSTERGNLRKALLIRNSYTWSTFEKGLGILGVTRVQMTVTLTWAKRKTYHTYTFSPGFVDNEPTE